MRSIYEDIIAKMDSLIDENSMKLVQFCNVWNDNFERLKNGEDEGCMLPSVYIEIENDQPINQLGDSVQIYDLLLINIHILHEKYNEYQNDDSYQAYERNLEVLDFKQKIYNSLQKFRLSGGGGLMIRTSETIDENHGNISHFMQQFSTTFVDNSDRESTKGIEVQANTIIPQITIDIQ